MAVSKLLLTEFNIHHRLESCDPYPTILNQLVILWLVASSLSTSCLKFYFFRYDVGNLNYTIPNFLTGLLTDLNFSITDVSNLQLTLDEMAKWVNSLSDNALLNVMVVFGLPILTAGLTGDAFSNKKSLLGRLLSDKIATK